MNLYETLIGLGGRTKRLREERIEEGPVNDDDIEQIQKDVSQFAQTWLASHSIPVAPVAPIDVSSSESGSESDAPAGAGTAMRSTRAKNKHRKAEKHVLQSMRKVLGSVDGRTHVGKTVQRGILLATCEAPPAPGEIVDEDRTRMIFRGLKAGIARVLGVRPPLVDEGQVLNKKHRSGTLLVGDFVRRRKSGRAITEATCKAIRAFYLEPANTRESPCTTDQILVRNPTTGKKDLRVSKHWLEVPLRILHKRWRDTVRRMHSPRHVYLEFTRKRHCTSDSVFKVFFYWKTFEYSRMHLPCLG